MIRVAVVDDQELVRIGFRMILEQHDDIVVVGEAADGEAAIALVATCDPDVTLMDVRMPIVDGVEATRRIVASDPTARILVLTTFDLDEYAFAALRVGASGFLLKNVPTDELVRGIRAVANGDAVVAPRVTRSLLDRFADQLDRPVDPPVASKLTRREHDVVREIAAGLSNAEIADLFTVSETTVKSHVANILTKLDLRNRVHIVIYAYEHQLVGASPGGGGPWSARPD